MTLSRLLQLFLTAAHLLPALGLEEGSYSQAFGVYIGRLRAYSTGIAGQVRRRRNGRETEWDQIHSFGHPLEIRLIRGKAASKSGRFYRVGSYCDQKR